MPDISRRALLAGVAAAPAFALEVSGRYSPATLRKTLLPRGEWKPFPRVTDREAWAAVPAAVKQAVLAAAEPWIGKPYAPLPATLFLEYARNGNRSHFENVQFGRRAHLRQLVLAECVERKGRLLDEIADGVWSTCEETFWGVPAHLSAQKSGVGLPDVSEPIIELFAAETGALLAWTDYLVGAQLDSVNPLVRARIAYEVERRILAPYRDRIDFWWMGLDPRLANRTMNNWNPWINSNVLTCVLLMDGDETRRAATAHKVLTSIDRFLASYHSDGGCDEGPGYWSRAGGSLFDNLELLHSASKGAIDYYSDPLVREIGRYIYRAHIADDWFVNFADASAKIHLDGDLVYRYGVAIQDANMRALGAYAAQQGVSVGDSLGRALPAIFNYTAVHDAEGHQPFVRDVWLDGIQVAAARRKAGSADGFYFAALGGHNAESHNHNDVGNFIVFLNGDPVLIDVGVETYTAKTFSPRRYEIWTMQSAYHNLPTINGAMQNDGRQYEARELVSIGRCVGGVRGGHCGGVSGRGGHCEVAAGGEAR
jgi:Heparinase II/III-like protein